MTVLETIQSKNYFIKECIPLDFTNFMGQYALEVHYTNGDKEVFTTPSTNSNVFGKSDFKSNEEYFETLKILKKEGLIK